MSHSSFLMVSTLMVLCCSAIADEKVCSTKCPKGLLAVCVKVDGGCACECSPPDIVLTRKIRDLFYEGSGGRNPGTAEVKLGLLGDKAVMNGSAEDLVKLDDSSKVHVKVWVTKATADDGYENESGEKTGKTHGKVKPH